MQTPTEIYISAIQSDLRNGKATEYTYRSALETFMESLGRGIDASNDPKHIECGAPDFIVEKGKVPLGYVETKDIGTDLDKVEKSDQIKRYLKALHNLILTDYLEFRWYVNGERKLKMKVAEIGKNDRLNLISPAGTNLEQLFRDFYATEAPTVTSPKELANRLAGVTHFIRDQIIAALTSGDAELQKSLDDQFNAFKELLLPALKPEEFADLYAQAMTYGLFAAKLSAPEGEKFTLAGAYQFLFGNKFLRRLFSDVSEELDEIDIIRPYLQDIVSLLNRADFASILADFGRRTRTEDPVVHFYETFLAAYDPKMRESRGVYYTPEPVVQFIVRAVDDLLKSRFEKPWGLADESVKVLDPATGTGTFLYYVIQQIHQEVMDRKQGGYWPEKSKGMLGRIFGFELLIAPYVVSHLKLGLELKNLGAPLEGKDERLHVYLTNTLEEGISRSEQLAGLGSYIAEEASEASRVKKQKDIMVVLGNPPYSNFGMMNRNQWISDLLEDYKKDLNEKKINLDDDYIKFIRFGQNRIDKTGIGILAFITNNSYLDGITHRQMRKSLVDSFSEIYILNLHGNLMKHEQSPDGSRDSNVFDITQGVSISIFIKDPNSIGSPKVFYTDLFGSREEKYKVLESSHLTDLPYKELENIEKTSCLGTFRFFTPFVTNNIDEYCNGWSIYDIFVVNQNGIKTDRDDLFFDFDQNELNKRMEKFYSGKAFENGFKERFRVENSSSYDLISKRSKTKFDGKHIVKTLYRPFDNRWLYYSQGITSRPAYEVMKHVVNLPNLGLIFMRQVAVDEEMYSHFLASDLPVESRAFYSNKGIMSLAPLYIYKKTDDAKGVMFEEFLETKEPNLSIAFIREFSKKIRLQFIPDGQGDLKTTFGPEDVFCYAYAVFHSPTYRSRYAEFLKIDFPRLPLTSDQKLFSALVSKGKELVDLHLLRTKKVNEFITSYAVSGNNKVEKVGFAPSPQPSPITVPLATLGDAKTAGRGSIGTVGNVWINATQYFGGVPEEVWNFKVGGYQVCDKWLKDRKGRVLSGEEIGHYQRVVVALRETIRLMKEIDEVIPGWPLE